MLSGTRGFVRNGRFEYDPQGDYVAPDLLAYSDYSGSLVQASNIKAFESNFEDDADEWENVHGSHGWRGIAIRRDADERVPAIAETLDALDEYPLLDEGLHSEMEREAVDAQWDSQDFLRALKKGEPAAIADVLDELPGDFLEALFWKVVDKANINGGSGYVNEQGDSIHFYFDEAAKWLKRKKVQLVITDMVLAGAEPDVSNLF